MDHTYLGTNAAMRGEPCMQTDTGAKLMKLIVHSLLLLKLEDMAAGLYVS